MLKEPTLTKNVRIVLVARTLHEYEETLAVPADMSDAELDALLDQRYAVVDPSRYEADVEYWERSVSTRHEAAEASDTPTEVVTRGDNGAFTLTPR